MPNKSAAGKGGIPALLHAGRAWPARLKRHNSFGVEVPTRLLPRVARSSQPLNGDSGRKFAGIRLS